MARTAETYTAAALEALNAGFSSKAGQKTALDNVTRAYELVKETFSRAVLAVEDRHEADGSMKPVYKAVYWDIPSYPHQYKDKHDEAVRAAFGDRFDAELEMIDQLVQLRELIKAAPINAPVRAEPSVFEVKARETIADLMERRKAQFARALDLHEVFGGLPVTANSHWVVNEHGTRFIRTFFYLRGELTPLNLIIAAAEQIERQRGLAA